MPASSCTKCLALSAVLFLITATGMAASIDFYDDNVWLVDSSGSHVEARATCQSGYRSTTLLRADGANVSVSVTNATNITRSTIVELWNESGMAPGVQTIELYCGGPGGNKTATDSVMLRRPSLEIIEPGAGFVGRRLSDSERQDPLLLDVNVNGEAPAKDDVSFRFSSRDGRFAWTSGDPWRLTGDGNILIRPTLQAFIPDDDFVTLHFNVTRSGETVSFERDFTPQTFAYDPEIVSTTVTPEIGFNALLGNSYLYSIDQGLEQQSSASQLKSGDVALTVTEVGGEDEWKDKTSWLDFRYTKKGSERKGEIVIGLSNKPPINHGRYDFTVEILRPGDDIVIDRFRVVNEQQVNGIVRQPDGSGIVTRMFLKYTDSTERVLRTDADGRYSFPLAKPVQYAELGFFESGREQPEGRLRVNSPDFSTEANTDYEAIKFAYYRNPDVSQRGLNPVNMMAVKFGYHIDGEVSGSMKIWPTSADSKVSLNKMNVYECVKWNMLSEQCQGTWDKMSDDDYAYDPINNRINIHTMSLREFESGDGSTTEIIKNAYVAGVPAELRLQGEQPLTVNKQRIKAGGNLRISGTVVSTKNGGVDDASVTLTLRGEDARKTYTAETSSNGRFTIEGDAPQQPGDYSVSIRLEKDPFVPFTLQSEQSIEVFYETGMMIDASSFSQIRMGNESELTFEIQNTGQAPIHVGDVVVEGMNGYAQLADKPAKVPAGESREATVLVSLPSDFCSYPCSRTPELDISVEGESAGNQLSAETTISASIPMQEPEQQQTQPAQRNGTEEKQSSFIGPTARIIQSQSDMNIALGMILVFAVVLAAAVKRKKNQQDGAREAQVSGGNGGGQQARPQFEPRESKISRPEVASSGTDQDGPDDADAGSDDEELEPNGDGKYVCEATGETFDTEAALKMYKKMNDIE